MSEPETTYLEYGLTPFDSMPQADLLLHAKRLYDACNSLRSVAQIISVNDDSNPFWAHGSGAKAIEKGVQACDAVEHGYSREDIYRSYYRYATDLLFESKGDLRIGFGWVVCTGCMEMWAAGDHVSQQWKFSEGRPCTGWGHLPEDRTCKGVYRLLTWDDLKPVKDEAA